MGRSELYSDVQLREFGQDEARVEYAARALGPLSLESWRIADQTPLDGHPYLTDVQRATLDNLFSSITGEESSFCYEIWRDLAAMGGAFIQSMGRMYRAAHAYTARWRYGRSPTALLPGQLEIFKGDSTCSLRESVRR